MKTPIKNLLMLLVATAVLAGCKGKKNSPTEGGDPGANGTEVIAKLHYYNGGWFGPSPNWTDDMTINFTQYSGGGYAITSKDFDPLCIGLGKLSLTETQDLFDLYSALTITQSTGVTLPDVGYEYIELTTSTGVVHKFHLRRGAVPAGEWYATNPSNLSHFLQDLNDSLTVACQ